MEKLYYVPLLEIKRIRQKVKDPILQCEILADVFRVNVLYMVRKTGSGHLGSSFSSADIVTWLFLHEMANPNDKKAKHSDIYFSSKGHDVPALYAVLMGLGKLDFKFINKLRRLGGLPGHPDVSTPYIVTNTGSLGMGISKAKGMALAKRLAGKKGRIFVMVGDGELQEGQIWEALEGAVREKLSEITVIIDNNKIQSDTWTEQVSDTKKIEEKFKAFGWEIFRCNGHDFKSLQKALSAAKKVARVPQVIIADTVKGKGISFMEIVAEDGFYKYHSGAPSFELYEQGLTELVSRANDNLKKIGLKSLRLEPSPFYHPQKGDTFQRLVPVYGEELLKLAQQRKDLVVLNADLVLDCGLIPYKKKFIKRFVECGIAEQDMVSMAGGLALQNKLPIVHSFASFLTTRPNEQIYNNATEGTKIIYVGFLAGLLPGTPGHSHQSVRDISCLGGMPGMVLLQPCCEQEMRLALRWAVQKSKDSVYLRVVLIAFEAPGKLPKNYRLELGKGVFLKEGKDAVLISYGPVMLTQAVRAAEELSKKGVSLAVINLPWLNRVDERWLSAIAKEYKTIFTLDDHYLLMGQGQMLAGVLARQSEKHPKVISFGLAQIPVCGLNDEVLKYHELNSGSLARKIKKEIRRKNK